jgi:hypothetical protein
MRALDARIYPLWRPNPVGAPQRAGPRIKSAGDAMLGLALERFLFGLNRIWDSATRR